MKNRIGKITIGILIFFVVIGVLFAYWGIKTAHAVPLDTYHAGWKLIRAAGDEDGASFSAVYDLTGVGTTAGNFASKDSGAYFIPSKYTSQGAGPGYSAGRRWQFIICGKNYNNVDDTASFNLVGWAKSNGPLQVICEGSIVLGTQAVVVYPDGGDALGELISETAVTYTHATTTFTVENEGFDGAVAGMLARVTGTDLTNAIVQVTTATDSNTIVCSGVTSSDNNTDSTVQINPAFWADTITLDETTKWSGNVSDPNTNVEGKIEVLNNADNEIAVLEVDLTGMEWIQFVFYDCDAATGDEAGDIKVYGRPI
jgi:hypothetical protein